MGADERVVVGVDLGTLSGRAVVVRVRDGAELASAVTPYASGVVDRTLPATGAPLPADWALQVPQDWVEVLRDAVPRALAAAAVDPRDVIGIGTDATSCTVLPVLADGTPLSALPELRGRPHAYAKLWKHHAAQDQADRVTAVAREHGAPWLARCGGRVSAEGQLAKALQLLEEDPEVAARTAHWVEAADWVVWQLCGTYVANAASAGYKAHLQDGAYPSAELLAAVDPELARFVERAVRRPVAALGTRAGGLTEQAAGWTGLLPGTAVCVGNVDAHVTAPAAQAVDPGQLLLVMGTSTCHLVSAPVLADVPGVSGVVDGGVVAGLWGYEAGQSGVGDLFAWYVDTSVPAAYAEQAAAAGVGLHEHLSALAAHQAVGEHGLLALDWHGGNRSVLHDAGLSGLVVGLTLQTRPEDVYRALVEATAFGTRVVVETLEAAGVPVHDVVVAGGLVRNPFLLQVYADVLRRPLDVLASEHGSALGAAVHAAVAAGAHPDVPAAARAMGRRQRAVHVPDPDAADRYDALYAEYVRLHDHFGRGAGGVMHRLRALRREALGREARAGRLSPGGGR